MSSNKKPPPPKPVPQPAPAVTMEDEAVKAAGDDERRRMAAQSGRKQTVTSRGYKTVLG